LLKLVAEQPWWSFLVRGIFAIIFGFLIMASPGAGLTAFVIFFGAYSLVDGIFSLAASFKSGAHRAWLTARGIFGLLAGIVTFAWPGITVVALFLVVASWVLVTGIFEIIAGIGSKAKGRWLLILGGVVSVIVGWLLLAWPEASLLAIVWVIGLEAIIAGIALIALGATVKGQQKAA
jgi:uncharacterized membrane protein HdeD (DUF308 family)